MKTKVKKVMGVSSYIIISVVLIYTMSFTTSASAQRPINIGYVTPFTGIVAMIGLEEAESVKMAVEEANAAGGINGRTIKLFIYDNGSDPAKTVANLKRCKEKDHCVAIIGPITSTENLAAKAWADENHIPIITTSTTSDKLLQKEGKAWWFRLSTPTFEGVRAVLGRVKKLGHTKVAFEATTLAWGTDWLEGIKSNCSKYSLELVGQVLCEPQSKDLTIQSHRLSKMGAEAIIQVEYPIETSVFAKALKVIGWKPYVLNIDEGAVMDAIAASSPELFEGWECKSQISRIKPYVRKVWDKYEKYTGKRFEDEKVVRAYDIGKLLIEILRLSDNVDNPEAIRDAFYKVKDFPLAVGREDTKASFEIGRNHLLTERDSTFYRVVNGKLVEIKD
jgi:branched-chain amino acid transport system substrate-binding protein